MSTDSRSTAMFKFAILSMFFAGATTFIVNPVLASIAAQYPNVSPATITYVSTIPNLLMIPFSLISGSLAGRVLPYKTLAVIALACISFGGAAAFFVTSFPLLIVTRIIVGIGVGINSPLGTALILRSFKGDECATMNGLSTTVSNCSGVILQMVSGALAVVNVQLAWVLHLIMILPLIAVLLFFKEPERGGETTEKVESATVGTNEKIPFEAIAYCVFYGIMAIGFYPVFLGISTIVTSEGIGDTALVGTITACLTVGGALSGIAFPFLYRTLGRRWTIPACMAVITACAFLTCVAKAAVLFMAALALGGFAIFVIWSGAFMEFGQIVPASRIGFISGLFNAVLNVGIFGSSLFMGAVAAISGDANPRTAILIGAVVCAMVTVAWTLVIFHTIAKYPSASEQTNEASPAEQIA